MFSVSGVPPKGEFRSRALGLGTCETPPWVRICARGMASLIRILLVQLLRGLI